eukprot:Rhum_TRINITY_DN15166_c4_g1::Rhum_TRINITY_DN15166_c4_g1_i9::g.141167::m.141167
MCVAAGTAGTSSRIAFREQLAGDAGWVPGARGSKCDILTVGDFYILLTMEGLRFLKIADLWTLHKLTWKLADVATKGMRVFAFIHDEVQTTYDALATAELFLRP